MRTLSLLVAAASTAWLLGGCSGNGSTWTDRTAGTAAASHVWTGLASDSTGARLVAVSDMLSDFGSASGDIWTSTDSGKTWIDRTKGTQASGQNWQSVASDATGAHLVAVAVAAGTAPDGVWTSADAGGTWSKQATTPGQSVASDATGKHLVLASGDVWTSSDSGATWTDRTAGTGAQGFAAVASDSTGAHLVAITRNADVWTSADSGATWTNRTKGTAASGSAWASVASDSTGTHLVAVCQPYGAAGGGLTGGDIWTSADSGATWNNRTAGTSATALDWTTVASDATGAHLVAASSGDDRRDIWTSSDSGATWTDETAGTSASGNNWGAVASDATGAHLVAASTDPRPPAGASSPIMGGDIWTN